MKARKGFTGTPGRPTMKTRGWDGTAEDKQRIEELRKPQDGTWSMVSAAAACDRSLAQVTAFTVLALLGKYRNTETGECFPSAIRLARDLGIERRSVQRHLDKLVERGYLVVVPRRVKVKGAATRQTSNAFVMLFPPMPASAPATEDEETAEGWPTPQPDQNPPSEARKPAAAGATPCVAAEGGEAPREGQNEPRPLRHMVASAATHDGTSAATPCVALMLPSNDPILNAPFAEANARERARAAAAQEPDQDVVVGQASTEAVGRPEARQVVPVPGTKPMYQRPRDPVGDVVRWVASATGRREGELWGTALQWHADLEAAGLTDAEAQEIIADEGRVARQHGPAFGDPVELIGSGIRARIDDRLVAA